jgi:MoCo/4Fe-4S cofactor protein with predicted Tat translocation signal
MQKELTTINETSTTTNAMVNNHNHEDHSHDHPSSHELRGASTEAVKSVDSTYWRSMDQLADSQEYQDFLHREFPSGASELQDPVTRRNFMKIMGASVALAGMAACRMPKETIVPYVKSPENVIPGKPKFYASTMSFADYTYGVLVENHEGRPTKIEGNELHPTSKGATHPWALASVLSLYDPDRSKSPMLSGAPSSWNQFEEDYRGWTQTFASNKGAGLAVISESFGSPAVESMADAFRKQYPNATWATYEPVSQENVVEGIKAVSGKAARPAYHLENASIIVAIDSDFLGSEPDSIRLTREFSKGRRVHTTKDTMNRLYAIESTVSSTGAMADHRLGIESSKIPGFLMALHKQLGLSALPTKFQKASSTEHAQWIKELASDLKRNRSKSVLIAGTHQSALVHALVALINQGLASSSLVTYHAVKEGASSTASLKKLSQSIEKKQIKTLIILGGNPAYNAPVDFKLAEGIKQIENTVHVSQYMDETSGLTKWHLPLSHYLESWSDAESIDGTLSLVQPLIQPLYDSKNMLEVMHLLVNKTQRSGYDMIVEAWKNKNWKQSLHDGVYKSASSVSISQSSANLSSLEISKVVADDIEVVFQASPSTFDGRFANNGWLQETPQPITKVTWDNPALISPALAKKHELKNGQHIVLHNGGRSLEIPVFIVPGQAKNSVLLNLGYGRDFGTVAKGHGVNTYLLRSSANPDIETGFSLTSLPKVSKIASTQLHGSMEGRPLVREATKEHFNEHPDFAKHMVEHPPLKSLWKEREYSEGYQWGMVIDLNTCTGCNSCITSCQSENNIPIVGKEQVAKGREMHWIRIDRYFSGSEDAPMIVHQPIPCMHCENAPCEQVCPVNATVHDKEGLNTMAYNRCIGTRYCSNNCPYKVRRFNFFNYTKDTPQVEQMAANPDVTIRFRGVMEKCTYCTQRINEVRSTAKLEERTIRDGEIKTACQQACPAECISFGNILDPNSEVSKMKKLDTNYSLLEELNIKPRTTYLAKLRNPNPAMKGLV